MSVSHRQLASRTALMVAAYRGLASGRPGAICHDPHAGVLAGEEGREIAARFSSTFPAMELWVALRTAFLDAQVEWWVRGGSRQVVILGAGFDTRAARLAREGLSFFEVDHPATQADKRQRLARITDYPASAAHYVPCDFERDELVGCLKQSGFSTDQPAVVLWEGVVPYLTEPAVRKTLHTVAHELHPRSVIAFDYLMKTMVESQTLSESDARTRAQVEELGEPLRFGTNHPLPLLHEEGFGRVRTISFDEIALDFGAGYDRARQFRFQHVALASREAAVTV